MYVMEIAEPTCWNKKRKIVQIVPWEMIIIKTDLVINGVKLGQYDAINQMWVVLRRVIGQSCIEFNQLIHRLISHQSLA